MNCLQHATRALTIVLWLSLAPAWSGTATVGKGATAADLAAAIQRTKLDFAVRRGLFRRFAAASLAEGRIEQGMALVTTVMRKSLPNPGHNTLSEKLLGNLGKTSDALLFLAIAHDQHLSSPPPGSLLTWLLATDERLRLVVDTLTSQDRLDRVFQILDSIHRRDPRGAEKFFRLALAIAVVWDQPRPPLHGQIGKPGPGKPAAPVELFEYFRDLYSSNDARLSYDKLSTQALILVVDTPVPLSELQWARQNVRGSASSWKRKFFDIRYDTPRLGAGRLVWPYGPYTLAAIRRHGGICVDQAYYAVMTARACGIPAMLFVGGGRHGGHGWLGYMKDEGKWEVDAGRYAAENYATGYTVDPQTNRRMTDHDVTLAYDRSLQTSRFDRAALFGRLAAVCLDFNRFELADALAKRACDAAPLYQLGWRIREELCRRRNKPRDLLDLLDAEATAFRRFPDTLTKIRAAQADILRKLGRGDDADRVLRQTGSRVKRKRDDLGRSLGVERITQQFDKGDRNGAIRNLERLLRSNRNEGEKVIPLVQLYLVLTRKTDRTHDAVRFLKGYLTRMQGRYQKGWGEPIFLNLLLKAYENDGDRRKADRLRKKIDRK